MGWKNWPYWLRGGAIGVLVGILILFIPFVGLIYIIPVMFVQGLIFNLIGLRETADLCFSLFSSPSFICVITFYPINVILSFIIGALIGLIIGKIKSKNRKGVNT